ncbi:TatD family hydrolase [Treponema sp.]|uniref:TatD family hydrolase n=1 Tax=Treponema sp. TaxID=166 RepID=UPI0025D8278C|nr:TatD family hydrolase [Treponema sp.]MCR5219181.1 TatD family hydrolase [Treponema sp.]
MFRHLFFDAHFHLIPSLEAGPVNLPENYIYSGMTCAHSRDEFILQHEKAEKLSSPSFKIYEAFGLHPQNPLSVNLGFLEELLAANQIRAVGECGFDFYSEEYRRTEREQHSSFSSCLELAVKYQRPMVIHDRKALEALFYYKKLLAKLPSCIFHGFAFGINEALSLINNGINAYFSFGKNLLRGSRKNAECLLQLDKKRILLETDAPFMTLKKQAFTPVTDISEVYKKAGEILELKEEELCCLIKNNFNQAYFLSTSTT